MIPSIGISEAIAFALGALVGGILARLPTNIITSKFTGTHLEIRDINIDQQSKVTDYDVVVSAYGESAENCKVRLICEGEGTLTSWSSPKHGRINISKDGVWPNDKNTYNINKGEKSAARIIQCKESSGGREILLPDGSGFSKPTRNLAIIGSDTEQGTSKAEDFDCMDYSTSKIKVTSKSASDSVEIKSFPWSTDCLEMKIRHKNWDIVKNRIYRFTSKSAN